MAHSSCPIPPRSVSEAATVCPESLHEVEPMQVGRNHLAAEEKQRCLNQRLCLYCGKSGHFAAACPLKPELTSRWGSIGERHPSI